MPVLWRELERNSSILDTCFFFLLLASVSCDSATLQRAGELTLIVANSWLTTCARACGKKKKTPEDALGDKTIIMMCFLRHFEAQRNLQLSRDCVGTFFYYYYFYFGGGDRIRSAHDSFLVVSVSVGLHAVCVPGWSIATSPSCKCSFHVFHE